MNGLRMIFGLFTIIPMGRFSFDEATYQRWLWALVPVGLMLSAAGWLVSQLPIDQPLRGILILLSYVLLTGAIHLDALGDAFDGLLSRRDRSRTLEIMRDPHLGSFGLLGLVFYLLLMAACLIMASDPFVFLFPLIGRLMAFVVCWRKTPARSDGLGRVFIEGAQPIIGWLGLANVVFIAIFFHRPLVALAVFISLAFGLLSERRIDRRLGGMTGDTIGCLIELSQLSYLLVLSVGA
ncbi:MAG TPA: adenosylcobinamide-GDP ribazoletransferase [Tissierellia bacterium]|nr:adenosylcobinamide-GDP ribazoletransferase [Tissierellia bacterium]